jgi:mono/diheme cytochrome c family protein
MIHSAKSKFALLLVLLFSAASFAAGQEKSADKDVLPHGNVADGAKIYRDYCAGCHGKTGMGDGPAASVLNTKPPDLTALSERHGNKFPSDYLAKVLRFGVKTQAHGSEEMPTWGPLFGEAGGGTPARVNQRIADLLSYLETVQKKPKKKE